MIEKKFVAEKLKMLQVKEFMAGHFGKGKYSSIDIKKTPLGEKIIVYTSKPGLIVGKQGENIKSFTHILKTKFQMENPQIEVAEVNHPHLDVQTMADYIVNTLERFGPKRFKSIGYKALQMIMDAGAKGAEIHISGRGVPSSRAHTWRFYNGYLKKCGDISVSFVPKAYGTANLKSGTVGIKVAIMLPEIGLPDRIEVKQPVKIIAEQVPQKIEVEKKEEKKEAKKERKPRGAKKPKKEEKISQEEKEESKSESKEKVAGEKNKEGGENVQESQGSQKKEN